MFFLIEPGPPAAHTVSACGADRNKTNTCYGNKTTTPTYERAHTMLRKHCYTKQRHRQKYHKIFQFQNTNTATHASNKTTLVNMSTTAINTNTAKRAKQQGQS